MAGIRFSFVAAVYNVARYLPDFIASIEQQTFPLDRVEVIAVDDGSSDESLAVLQAWAARRPGLVTVLHKDNGGQGSARNLGLTHATGEWVTFLDPDDKIDPDYLTVVDRCIGDNPDVALVATNRIYLYEATGELRDGHPLRRMFAGGDRVVNIELSPQFFHGSAPSAFLRRAVLLEHDIRFDDRIRPNFEDGHFCARYLLAAGSQVAFLQSARYLYRRRSDGTSTLQNSLRDPSRFEMVPRHGYLALLQSAAGRGRDGYAPEWVQQFVLYELSWYFSADVAMTNSATAAFGATGTTFVETLREITRLLDPAVVRSFAVRRLRSEWRDVLLHLDDERWVTPYAVVTRYDAVKKLARIAYRYRGDAPDEMFLRDDVPAVPVYGKVRVHKFFGVVLLRERIAWVPVGGTTRLLLDGRPVALRPDWPAVELTTVRRWKLRSWFRPPATEETSREDALMVWLAAGRAARRLFRNAWVLMDRVDDAGDNGERLFRYLRDQREDINAWFVVDKNTPDWERLRADGYGSRIVAHGSRRWKLLMLTCKHLVSSHVDDSVRRPPTIMALLGNREPQWRFTFLQHGVIKDDLSRWLNPKTIDLMVTSTPAEHASIVGDGTPYELSDKEVTQAGLPRFDRLRELATAVGPTDRDLVLVVPTWRTWLNAERDRGSHARAVVTDFATSEYAQAWLGFLAGPTLRDPLAAQGLRLGFLPHPNVQPVLAGLDLPPHVEALSYAGTDVQQLIARAALMVTDYSSMAFNAGYVDRPVVYFQFDADRVFSGGHLGVKGYYDYARDGFGPVTTTLGETVAAVTGIVTTPGRSPGAQYVERFARTFPQRDGRCCERVTAAIENLTAKA